MKLATLQETKSTIRFSAKLFRPKATEKIGSWTLLTLPKSASAKLPSRGMTMVEGTINGFPFRVLQGTLIGLVSAFRSRTCPITSLPKTGAASFTWTTSTTMSCGT
jgi:hypothetical protein